VSEIFNYYDELKNGNTADWISYLNRHYMEANAPSVYVFKLDKDASNIDDLYGEETFNGARIYLPPFQIRMNYLDATWTQQLGVDTMPYLEVQEQDTVFAVNFENMVQTIRNLKQSHDSDIFVEYSGTEEVSFEKSGSSFTVRVAGSIIQEFNLESSNYRTVKKLVTAINNLTGFRAYYEGENDISTNIVNFRETRFKNKKLNLYIENQTYSNITDVIEKGDLILNDKYFLYEVQSNVPAGNIGWVFSIMLLTANTRSLDKAELPNNWNELIARREYGLRQQIDME